MLRASSDATGSSYEIDAIVRGKAAGDGNIPHGALLVEFTDAAHSDDETALAPLRKQIVEAMSEAALVDTCGVVANFQRVVRIADGTGIPLDEAVMALSSDLRPKLGVEAFEGARNSRFSAPRRFLHRVARPFLRRALGWMSRRNSKGSSVTGH